MKKIIFPIIMFLLLSGFVSARLSDSTGISINLINQNPDPATAGNIVEVRLGITNLGGTPTKNIILKLEPSYPFDLLPGESQTQSIGTLSAYQGQVGEDTKIIKFKVKIDSNAPAGSYDLKISSFESESPIITTRVVSLDVQNKEIADIIYIDKVELIPGKTTPLKFTITNVGLSPLADLTFSWKNSDALILPVGSDNTKHIQNLGIGNHTDLTFNVIASTNADPDLYKLDLTLSYLDSITGKEEKITSEAGVYIGGETDFDVAFSGVSNGATSLSVSNIGSVSAGSVTVKIPAQKGWSVSGGNSVIIGNLNNGDYTIVSFELTQGTSALGTSGNIRKRNGSFNQNLRHRNISDRVAQFGNKSSKVGANELSVEVSYTDSRGIRHTITKQVAVESPTTSSQAFSGISSLKNRNHQTASNSLWKTSKWVLLGLVVLILGFIYYKKKHNKKLRAKI